MPLHTRNYTILHTHLQEVNINSHPTARQAVIGDVRNENGSNPLVSCSPVKQQLHTREHSIPRLGTSQLRQKQQHHCHQEVMATACLGCIILEWRIGNKEWNLSPGHFMSIFMLSVYTCCFSPLFSPVEFGSVNHIRFLSISSHRLSSLPSFSTCSVDEFVGVYTPSLRRRRWKLVYTRISLLLFVDDSHEISSLFTPKRLAKKNPIYGFGSFLVLPSPISVCSRRSLLIWA
ncbi:unnamed protein product [Lactuca saligna]|uniref:Uncharacterized protein n=1 Tax=Lactuca saligna TaxID=75948 RepID=A0AA35YR28_LACSI|nr:unnamed protein product [Lactuca saligna]